VIFRFRPGLACMARQPSGLNETGEAQYRTIPRWDFRPSSSRPKRSGFEVANCDLKVSNFFGRELKAKSAGIVRYCASPVRSAAWLDAPYRPARSESKITLRPRRMRIVRSTRASGTRLYSGTKRSGRRMPGYRQPRETVVDRPASDRGPSRFNTGRAPLLRRPGHSTAHHWPKQLQSWTRMKLAHLSLSFVSRRSSFCPWQGQS